MVLAFFDRNYNNLLEGKQNSRLRTIDQCQNLLKIEFSGHLTIN